MYSSDNRKKDDKSLPKKREKLSSQSDVFQEMNENVPRVKEAAQLQAIADDFVQSKQPVQMRRVTVVYRGGTVIGHDTEQLTLDQLQNLLLHPDLSGTNRRDLQTAIQNGEYIGGQGIQQNAQQNQQMPPPQSVNTGFSSMEMMPPPPPRVKQSSQESMGPPSSNFMGPPQQGFMGPPPPRVKQSSQESMGPPQQGFMGPPSMMGMMPPPSSFGQSSKMSSQSSRFSSPQVRRPPVEQEQILTLYRGLHSIEQGQQIIQNMSAGGVQANPDCGKPSQQDMVAQVGMDDVMPNASRSTPFKQSDVTEYTADPRVAQLASKGNGVLMIKISSKYLIRGDSGIMNGWIALKSAPLISAELM